MTAIPDHVLFVVLAVLGPVWAATVGYQRLLRAAPADMPRVRGSVYIAAIVMQWCLTGILGAWWLIARRPWGVLGLIPRPTMGLAGALLGSAIVIVYIARQRQQALATDESLALVRERLRHIEPMLPRTPRELRTFIVLSVTAGISEELLYRGFMLWYLAHFTSLVVAGVIAAAIFGIGHSYQGARGMLLTGMVGSFFVAVYLVSGSLFVPMLLHALMDIHSGHLAYVALRRWQETAPLEGDAMSPQVESA